MNCKLNKTFAILAAAGFFALSATAQAPTSERKQASFRKDFGISQVGGYVHAYQGATRDVKQVLRCYNGTFTRNASSTYAGLATGARIFGKNIEAARVESRAEAMDVDTYKVPVIRKIKKYRKKYYWTWKKVGFVKVPVRRYRWVAYYVPTITGYRTYGVALPLARFTNELRIGGKTVNRKVLPFGAKYVKKVGPYNIFKKNLKKTFIVGPVPVTVTANAGFAGSISCGAEIDRFKKTTELGPKANAHGFGWVKAGVGGKVGGVGAEAGVKGTLKFANTTVGYKLSSSLEKLFGGFYWKVVPVGFTMSLYAEVKYLVGKVKASLRVWKWSMKAFGGSKPTM